MPDEVGVSVRELSAKLHRARPTKAQELAGDRCRCRDRRRHDGQLRRGVALISRVRRFTCNFEAALFGTVTGADFWIIAGVCVGGLRPRVPLLQGVPSRDLGPGGCPSLRGADARAEALLALLLAAVVIAALQVIGVTMRAAAIVTPRSPVRVKSSIYVST